MMAVLFMSSIILYYFRQRIMHSWKAHVLTFTSMYSFYVDHYCFIMAILQPFAVAERQFYRRSEPHTFTPLWQSIIGWLLMAVWFITLILLISLSKLRNIFWFSGAFFCSAYLFTLFQLLSTAGELDQTWYQARFFGNAMHLVPDSGATG